MKFIWTAMCTGLFLIGETLVVPVMAKPVQGWLNWRGPDQCGVTRETQLPDQISLSSPALLWTADFAGQSAPVIAEGKLYIMGYVGDGPALQEGVGCFDAETGKLLWRQVYSDFLSDTIYHRYAISNPVIDPETGHVFMQGSQGILAAFTAEGQPLWNHSLMELYGRLTFPNSRTGSPAIDGDLVVSRGITANWGGQGPGADRFYAFDKNTGELVWASTPGDRPQDNSFSYPVFSWLNGRRVLFAATGDGSVVCVNARTGDPIWRIPLFKAGINSSLLVHHGDKLITIYGTPYEPGQMVALKIPQVMPANPAAGPVVVNRSDVEIWNNELRTSTSSPILVGDRVYLTSEVGYLCAVDADTGKTLWKLKLGIEQRHASPLFGDGKLYVPMLNEPGLKEESTEESTGGKGALYVIKPSDAGGQILSHVVLDGRCFGSPVAYNGKVYVQTTQKIYCFGRAGNNPGLPAPPVAEPWPKPGAPAQLQIIPSEILLHPGQTVSFRIRRLDANGFTVDEIKDVNEVRWTSFVPPTAKVKATLRATFNHAGQLVAASDCVPSAGAFEATYQGLKGYIRGRILPALPLREDFESFTLGETNQTDNARFAYPPLPWIGARFKFEVRDLAGNKVLVKTTDNRFFQRATVFMGDPDLHNYTVEADVMSDGNKRKMSDVGLIDQRYLFVLKGNDQKLEVTSNQELFRASVPFKWAPKTWYHLKTRVDTSADGSGTIRAKVWPKGESEPSGWTLEAANPRIHLCGSPGLFGFSPQDMRVYIDNINVTQN